MIRIIISKDEINSVKPDEKSIHFLFRPSSVDLLNLILKSPELQMIQVPPAHMRTLPKVIRTFFEVLDVKVFEDDVQYRINGIEYFTAANESSNTIKSTTKNGDAHDERALGVQKSANSEPDIFIRSVTEEDVMA
jgi:hypothetical protein